MSKLITARFLFIVGAMIAAGAIAFSFTNAFLSDLETSQGNIFDAGELDLGVDNHSFYNGELNPGTTWRVQYDLANPPRQFFNFTDLKPGDWGEDTISLHVKNNDSWLCADVKLTSNDDNGINEPEGLDGDITDGSGSGELADKINFYWWADDGDNVFENDETLLPSGPLGALAVGQTATVSLADSSTNIWSGSGPFPGDQVRYLAKAWCFGNTTMSPYSQDGGNTGTNGPDIRKVQCDGSALDNKTQTDSLTADITFRAIQSRDNPNFLCNGNGCTFDPDVNLVTNGGFEEPIVNTPDKWDVFTSPAGGWSADWRSDVPNIFNSVNRPAPSIELHRGVLGNAFQLEQYAELDGDWFGPTNPLNGEPASTIISQTITTTPGATYHIHFAFAPRPNTTADQNNLEVKWGASTVAILGPMAGGGSIVWSEYDYDVVATGTSTVLSFGDLGPADSLGTFLDDVSLKQTSCSNQIQ